MELQTLRARAGLWVSAQCSRGPGELQDDVATMTACHQGASRGAPDSLEASERDSQRS